MKIAYGNYGMPNTPFPEMLRKVAEIGYEGIEICVAPGYPTAPEQLDAAERRHLSGLLREVDLDVAAFLVAKVNVLAREADHHAENLAYLRRVLELRADLELEAPISSTLGGRTEEWDDLRHAMVQCVGDWAAVAAEHGATFAFEPHVGGLIHSPDRALWLLEQVDTPGLKVNFDYSHFELIDVDLEQALTQLLPYAAGIHVKDVSGRHPDFRFLLPGEGQLDYADYVRRLVRMGYDDFLTVEISGQIFNKPGYDAVAAAEKSYRTLKDAFDAAGIPRAS